MKYICGFMLIFVSVSLSAENIKTLDGKVYKNASITRVTPEKVVISYQDGVASVPFTDLPESIRKKYHYSPKKAHEYRKEKQSRSDRISQETNKLLKKEEKTLKKAWKKQKTEEAKLSSSGTNTNSLTPTLTPAVNNNDDYDNNYVYDDYDDGPIQVYNGGDIVPILYNHWHHIRRWNPYHRWHPYHPWHPHSHTVYQPHNLYHSLNSGGSRIRTSYSYGPRVMNTGDFGGLHGGSFHGGGGFHGGGIK